MKRKGFPLTAPELEALRETAAFSSYTYIRIMFSDIRFRRIPLSSSGRLLSTTVVQQSVLIVQ